MSLFLNTLHGKKASIPPIWLMRQAGRYLEEYKQVRSKFKSFVEFCLTPEAVVEVTLQPIRRFGFDASIIFSDILMIPYALGQDLQFHEGVGPILGEFNPNILNNHFNEKVIEKTSTAIKMLKQELTVPLIGFSGAPWTLACYMIQGRNENNFIKAHNFLYSKDNNLLEKIALKVSDWLIMQIDAGVDVIKIFDSWAGLVPAFDVEKAIINPTRIVVEKIKDKYPNIPIIGFPKGLDTHLLEKYINFTKVDAIALGNNFDYSNQEVKEQIIIQGGVDPIVLLNGGKILEEHLRKIMTSQIFKENPFIMNLAHGIHKDTPIKHVEFLIDFVRSF